MNHAGGTRTVDGRLLTTREVAAMLGLSPATVLRRVRAGELPAFRIATNSLRFSAAEVVAWLEAKRAMPPKAEGGRVGTETQTHDA